MVANMEMNKTERTKAWKEYSKSLRENGFCAVCGKDTNFNVHHILERKHYPQFMFEKKNLIVLCCGCHKLCRLSAHQNPVWFSRWLSDNRPEQYGWALANL